MKQIISGHRPLVLGVVVLLSLHAPTECRPIQSRLLSQVSDALYTLGETLSNQFSSLFESDPSYTPATLRDDFSGGCGGCGPYDFNKVVPAYTLVAVSYLLFYQVTSLVGKRRRRSLPDNNLAEQHPQGKDNHIYNQTSLLFRLRRRDKLIVYVVNGAAPTFFFTT